MGTSLPTLYTRTMSSFNVADAKVYFVLGGPGAGKGTQCASLVEEFGFTHLSAGDLLRAERDTGSEVAELINNYIREGLIVPKEITIGLLKTAMEKAANSAGYLIDGFPRALDQWTAFEETVVPAKYGLYFVCSEEELERRLLERARRLAGSTTTSSPSRSGSRPSRTPRSLSSTVSASRAVSRRSTRPSLSTRSTPLSVTFLS